MKRVFSLALVFVMTAMLAAGCTPASTRELADDTAQAAQAVAAEPGSADGIHAPEPEIPAGIDRTIEVDSYPIDLSTMQPEPGGASLLCFASLYQTVGELDKGSSLIVTGIVESVEFFQRNGFALTKIDMVASNVIKGGIAPGDKISVIIYGGYISLKDYMDVFQYGFQGMPEESEWPTTYMCENAPALGFPNPGDSYAYFLSDNQTYAGAYSTLNIDEGIFKGAADGSYTRINPYPGYTSSDGDKVIDSFTLDELREYFGKQPTAGRPLP